MCFQVYCTGFDDCLQWRHGLHVWLLLRPYSTYKTLAKKDLGRLHRWWICYRSFRTWCKLNGFFYCYIIICLKQFFLCRFPICCANTHTLSVQLNLMKKLVKWHSIVNLRPSSDLRNTHCPLHSLLLPEWYFYYSIYLFVFTLKYILNWFFLQLLGRDTVTIIPFMLHSLSMSMFSSVIGPFGGFFASGFKRAFKIKVYFIILFYRKII